ncbi:hypothetical protein C8R47DRAFT_1225246 [Mycena vitilis]|nr:hypothetical protein C8R47DRAFT_1225246 [Mycena vitilis]
MPLRRLHCPLGALFGYESIDFTFGMFASITHLELFDVPEDIGLDIDENVWMELANLPHLTHLAFNDEQYIRICLSLLRSPRLDFPPRSSCPTVSDRREGSRDATRGWIMGAYRGEDYWPRAEDFVERRKSGEVAPLEYYYILDSDEKEDRIIRFLGSLDSD